jgi:hypothetical protein
METTKLIVKTESANLWWGIYGICDNIGWEDLRIYNDKGKKIASLCLNTKIYLGNGMEDLKNDPNEAEFVQAIEDYLKDDKIHYWFYYNNEFDEDNYQVSYDAPRNEKGEKPRFMDIWHHHESIDLSTIKSAVENFAHQFLKLDNVEIEIEEEPFENSLKDYKKHMEHFGDGEEIQISFSDEVVNNLSVLWNKSKEETLATLNRSL